MNKADFISKLAVEMNISQQQSRKFMNAFQVVNTIYQYAESNNARNSYSNFFSKILHHDVIVLLFISFLFKFFDSSADACLLSVFESNDKCVFEFWCYLPFSS